MRKLSLVVLALLVIAGCGYSTKSLLPPAIKTVYIESFKNAIQTQELEYANYRTYRPLLERDVTAKIIDKFIYDRSLEVVSHAEEADLVLSGELVGYNRDPIRYTTAEDIEEYRLTIFVNMKLYDTAKDELWWEEFDFAGDITYFASGAQATTEATAIDAAIDNLARRIVERTVELW